MTHWMDIEPRRFGWRYWHLHDTGTKLFSPIHGAPPKFGRRFVESVCTHQDGQPDVGAESVFGEAWTSRPAKPVNDADPLALRNCLCGVYYDHDLEMFGEHVWHNFERGWPPALV